MDAVVPQSIHSLHTVTTGQTEAFIILVDKIFTMFWCRTLNGHSVFIYLCVSNICAAVLNVCPASCLSKLPSCVELHLDSTVQRRAAELKLQHKVNLRAKKSDTFQLEKMKDEWAELSERRSSFLGKDIPLTGNETLDSWRYMSGCWHQVLYTRS